MTAAPTERELAEQQIIDAIADDALRACIVPALIAKYEGV